MRSLYHFPIDPASRALRLLLAEKGLEVQLRMEKPWEQREEFLRLAPAGEVPVLVDETGKTIGGFWTLTDYLEEAYPTPPFMGQDLSQRTEVRRLKEWIAGKLAREASAILLEEKLFKRYLRQGTPDSALLRFASTNLTRHLLYFERLAEARNWLAGDDLSQADLCLAATLSCLDYVNVITWENYPNLKQWYARIKSRPSMRPFLAEFLTGFTPPAHYADLDF